MSKNTGDGELDRILMQIKDLSTFHDRSVAKTAIKKYAAQEANKAQLEAYDLLYWKYKELNGQSVDMKFVEAYNILTKEKESSDE